MQFINLNTSFSIFGNFPVFDEDTITLINKYYSNDEISFKPEPNNQANSAKRLLSIVSVKEGYVINFRPYRIDVYYGHTLDKSVDEIVNRVVEHFELFETMFEGCIGNRLAVVSNDFIFDEDLSVLNKITSKISFVDSLIPSTELNLRINTPDEILNEEMNMILNINVVSLTKNQDPTSKPQRAVMFVQDVNTLTSNDECRFKINEVAPYFYEMYKNIRLKLTQYEQNIE